MYRISLTMEIAVKSYTRDCSKFYLSIAIIFVLIGLNTDMVHSLKSFIYTVKITVKAIIIEIRGYIKLRYKLEISARTIFIEICFA